MLNGRRAQTAQESDVESRRCSGGGHRTAPAARITPVVVVVVESLTPSRSSSRLPPPFSSLSIRLSLVSTPGTTMSGLYQTLSEFTVEQLRALSWHYAVAAKGTEHAHALCIDPRQLKKADLRIFLSATVPELVEVTIPTKQHGRRS